MRIPKYNEVYRHYKGGVYVVHGVSIDRATMRRQVIYSRLTHKSVWWSRDLAEWSAIIVRNNKKMLRFSKVPEKEAYRILSIH